MLVTNPKAEIAIMDALENCFEAIGDKIPKDERDDYMKHC